MAAIELERRVSSEPLSSEHLLHEVSQLDTPDLDKFLDQVMRLRAARRTPHLSTEEFDLLLKINTPLPEAAWKRYSKLQAGLRADKLTKAEYAELLQLIDVVEIDNAQRIGHLAELARLRGTTLDVLMKSLGIGPRPHA